MEKVLGLERGSMRRRFPGSQVTTLDSDLVEDVLCKESYYVCEKTDGERYLLILLPKETIGGSVLMSRTKEMRLVPDLEVPNGGMSRGKPGMHNLTMVDGELVWDEEEGRPKFLIFDILILMGQPSNDRVGESGDVRQLSLCDRLRLIRSHVLQPSFSLPKVRETWPMDFGMKEMFDKAQTRDVFAQIKSLGHENDGLVFTPVNAAYGSTIRSGTMNVSSILKWKPDYQNTIDFNLQYVVDYRGTTKFLLCCPTKKGGVEPFAWLTLNDEETRQYLANRDDHHNKVGEYRYEWSRRTEVYDTRPFDGRSGRFDFSDVREIKEGAWVFTGKYRLDTPGNPVAIAVRNQKSIQDRISEDVLLRAIERNEMPNRSGAIKGKVYFTEKKGRDGPTRPMLDFHNWVKGTLYHRAFKESKGKHQPHLELAGGRGGDLFKVLFAGPPSEILLTDLDHEALQTAKEDRWGKNTKLNRAFHLDVQLADLGAETYRLRARDGTRRFTTASCMFAIHYFMEKKSSWENFTTTLCDAIAPDGVFFATFFDARKIRELLLKSEDSNPWSFRPRGASVDALSLTRGNNWKTDAAARESDPYGQELIVFGETIGKHKEYLLDQAWLVRDLTSRGFDLVAKGYFEDMYSGYFVEKQQSRKPMTKPQRIAMKKIKPLSFCNCWVVLRKRSHPV
eukprot:g3706.t1